MKKILAFFLAALMVMSFAACGNNNDSKETEAKPTEATPTDGATEAPVDDPTDAAVESNMIFFQISITDAEGIFQYMMAMPGETGVSIFMDTADGAKEGIVDFSALDTIDAALQSSGLLALESSPEGVTSINNATLSVAYGDGEGVDISIYGETPEAFTTGYAAMLDCFLALTADMAAPQPVVNGDPAASDKAALDGILANLELIGSPSGYGINAFPKDENFAFNMMLPSDAGIASGLQFSSMNTTNAYALYIVTLEEGTAAETIAASYENNIDWLKWICVQPENAYIATKGNQVLLLLGSMDFYEATVAAIEADGWTAYKTLVNPEFENMM